jgi:hypothetical protein
MIRLSTTVLLSIVVVCLGTTLGTGHQAFAQTTSDREKILNSDDWRNTMRDLHEWSSVQQIYDKDQLAKKKQQLDKKIAGMSADQLTDFLSDLKQKLQILHSDEARKARAWLDETMEVAAPAYAKKIRDKLPDVAESTAAQLQEQLDVYSNQIAARRKNAADDKESREQEVKQIREQHIRDQKARLQSEIAGEQSGRRKNPSVSIRRYNSYPTLFGGFRW